MIKMIEIDTKLNHVFLIIRRNTIEPNIYLRYTEGFHCVKQKEGRFKSHTIHAGKSARILC